MCRWLQTVRAAAAPATAAPVTAALVTAAPLTAQDPRSPRKRRRTRTRSSPWKLAYFGRDLVIHSVN